MLSYAGVSLQQPGAEEAAWIASKIPIESAFGFFRPKFLGDPALNPRAHFAWFLNRPMRVNSFYHPWGASRWGYSFILADGDMLSAILALNTGGSAWPFVVDDGLGSSVTTPLFMCPPVPLSKIAISPSLPLYLVPLVDERFFWWERATNIVVEEGVTTWSELFLDLATGLSITLTVDPISADYLVPSNGFTKQYQHLPLLLDLAALSVGQRIVRRFDGSFRSLSATTATSLMIANTNIYQKQAGGTLNFGVVDG